MGTDNANRIEVIVGDVIPNPEEKETIIPPEGAGRIGSNTKIPLEETMNLNLSGKGIISDEDKEKLFNKEKQKIELLKKARSKDKQFRGPKKTDSIR